MTIPSSSLQCRAVFKCSTRTKKTCVLRLRPTRIKNAANSRGPFLELTQQQKENATHIISHHKTRRLPACFTAFAFLSANKKMNFKVWSNPNNTSTAVSPLLPQMMYDGQEPQQNNNKVTAHNSASTTSLKLSVAALHSPEEGRRARKAHYVFGTRDALADVDELRHREDSSRLQR